ncbi:uncharacterized protein LOC124553269 [Schistocerca americana]|uniref:uncharacterized protein LOC124553269 n=1 Tax=Schistocerca americana TaxID=7009 RepID=UPI001F4F1AEF|nr:uncharacterized protein LOC124553269 [Schistocerca americana]
MDLELKEKVVVKVVRKMEIGQEDKDESGIGSSGMSMDSPLGHSTGYPETPVETIRKELSLEDGQSQSVILKVLQGIDKYMGEMLQEINKRIEGMSKGSEETNKCIEEMSKGNEEIKKENKEIKRSIAELSQESQENLRKGLQKFQEQMRITLQERDDKLQVKIDQLQEEMNDMRIEIIGKAEGDVKDVKTELEGRMR